MACPPSLQQDLCWPQLTWHETVSAALLVASCHQGPQPLSHRDAVTSGSQGGIAASQSRGGEGLKHTEGSGKKQEAMSQSTPDFSCRTLWEGYRPICSRRQHNIQIISKASCDGKKHINEIQSQNALMAVILSPEAQALSNYLQRGRMKKETYFFPSLLPKWFKSGHWRQTPDAGSQAFFMAKPRSISFLSSSTNLKCFCHHLFCKIFTF